MLVNEPCRSSQANLPLEHAASRRLYRHWEALRAEQAAPRRNSLDLRPIAALVANLGIIERAHPEADFTWRLAGTGVCALLGREATGNRVTWGLDAFEANVVDRFLTSTIQRLQPCVFKLKLVNDLREITPVEMLGLPLLSHDGRNVQILAGFFDFEDLGPRLSSRLDSIQIFGARSIWTEHLPGDTVVEQAAASSAPKPQFQIIRGGKP